MIIHLELLTQKHTVTATKQNSSNYSVCPLLENFGQATSLLCLSKSEGLGSPPDDDFRRALQFHNGTLLATSGITMKADALV